MATYQITSPDGGVHEITAPDGASQADILAYAQQNAQPHTAQKPPSWSDVPGNALSNLLPSAGHLIGGLAHAVAHPIDTAGNMLDIAAGGLHNALPDAVANFIDKHDPNPQAGQDAVRKADAVGKFYADRYGGADALKTTLSNDPVGALADASTVLTGGAGLARMGGNVARATPQAAKLAEALTSGADALQTGAQYTNPMAAVAPIANGIGNTALFGVKHGLGLTTGVGADNIGQALAAGLNSDKSFMNNLSGDVPMSDILDKAKNALATMRGNRSSDYRAGMGATAADTTPLDFSPIDKALNDVTSSMSAGGHSKISDAEANTVGKLSDIVAEWRNDPSMHTAAGLDALKQRIDANYPESPMQSQAQRANTSVRNAVKDAIVNQSPEYADTMSNYESALNLEKEITQALSLGNKSSQDTALRKLQSLGHNNANTNYGNRMDLAQALQEYGGQDIMPSIAGQSMNSWMPRGLVGQGEGLATLGAAMFHNPMLALALPFESPKAMGAALYGAGKVGGAVKNLADKIPVNAQQAQMAALLAAQAGNQPAK